jgi:hypothetical protein
LSVTGSGETLLDALLDVLPAAVLEALGACAKTCVAIIAKTNDKAKRCVRESMMFNPKKASCAPLGAVQ